ncbi:hypothetical protein QS306_08575 [Paraburkholderia bonniea]|uniref:hypothetical protein n=1 Tax=Paraburkholderia bonniea TaxID=2152891 RepID=UPI0012910781|nr:hypothetical protein [Paraburkholderia bonniea]WJF89190.1 hypothetical protein QS306_08575 [Paraburkholderia bonniea]WJF92506.1 hypothetical protein QS308_08585 [Paraburkholderia bonniea]
MKPLLRAVLMLNAFMLLAFGLLLLLTPWQALYDALQLVQVEPALAGQGFGIALVGLAWLALHASFDGAFTVPVARVAGHVTWLTGLLMLVWLIGLHTPDLTGFGQLVAGLTGAVLLIIGLGEIRLAGGVRRREKARIAEAAATARAEKPGGKAARTSGVVTEPLFAPAEATSSDGFAGARPAVSPAAQAEHPSASASDNDARDAAADTPAGPRPPFHG